MEKVKKVFIYARQSSGECADKSESVEMQIEKCSAFCKDKGYIIVAVYADGNNSGKAYPNTEAAKLQAESDLVYMQWRNEKPHERKRRYRRALGELFNNFHKVDGVVCFDKTRIMRPITNSHLAPFIIQCFGGKTLETIQEGVIDFNSFEKNIIYSLQDQYNDKYIADCALKSKQALKKLKDDGYVYGHGRIKGFIYKGNQQQAEINENEMREVKYIINAVNNGIPYHEIIKQVSNEDRGLLSYGTLVAICNRLEYSGKTLNSNGEMIDSKVYPCVIPLADMLQAQARVNNKRVLKRDKKGIHPLSGIVKCGYCHNTMRIQSYYGFEEVNEKGKLFNYICLHGRELQIDYCNSASIREFYQIDTKNGVIHGVLPFIYKHLIDIIKPKTDNADRIAVINSELEGVARLEKMLDKKYSQGMITDVEYEKRFAEYVETKKKLQQEKNTIDSSRGDNIENAVEIAKQIIDNRIIDLNIYKKIATDVFKDIFVYEDKIEVVLANNTTPITIERFRDKNQRYIPNYTMVENDGKIVVQYFYKTAVLNKDYTINTIFEDDNFIVQTVGKNPAPYEYLKKRKENKRLKRVSRAFLL